jgi:hypothetical protein
MTHCAGVAQHKGHHSQGQGKGNVVQETQKEQTFRKRCWMQQECNNGIKNRDLKEQLCLGSKGNVNKTFRETLGLEITNRIARSSVTIRKMSVRTLWRGWLPPKQ